MDILKALKIYIKKSTHSEEDHEQICMSLNVPPDAAPPLEVLTYAIYNILRPTFLLDQTPELLDLIAQVELIRQLATENAKKAMAWNRWYSQPNEKLDTILLDGHEVKTLSQLVDKTEIFRILYCGMIDRCVRLHILHIWTSDRAHHLPRFMKLYYPAFHISGSAHLHASYQRCLFHDGLSDEEQAEFYHNGLKCIHFLCEAGQWEENIRSQHATVTVEDYETAEFLGFRESLTEGYEADKTIEMIGGYLRKVEQYIGDLRRIFPDDTDDPDIAP